MLKAALGLGELKALAPREYACGLADACLCVRNNLATDLVQDTVTFDTA